MTDTKHNPDLLPCPFDGAEAEVFERYPKLWNVRCTKCGVTLDPDHRTVAACVEEWNTRAEQPSPQQTMGEVRDAWDRVSRDAMVLNLGHDCSIQREKDIALVSAALSAQSNTDVGKIREALELGRGWALGPSYVAIKIGRKRYDRQKSADFIDEALRSLDLIAAAPAKGE